MTPQFVRVTDEIHQVGGSGLTAPEDAAIYLVEFNGHAALIDSGCGGGEDRLLANVEALGVRPEAIEALLITHCHYDHTGGAHSLLSDEADYLASLQRLIDLDADILCEGHYGIFREKPEITRFIRSFMA